jgi:AcrR family transcriptional regulator
LAKNNVSQRRQEILEATCRVVIERGFAGTRVADVANALGISSALIHYHFESKAHLLAEALRWAAEADIARLRAAIDAESNALDKLDRFIRMTCPGDDEPAWWLWIDSWGEALRTPELAVISRELDISVARLLERVIEEGVREGAFRCADPAGAAWRLTALLDGLGVQATVHDDVITAEQMLAWGRQAAAAELGLLSATRR